jgi:hypothetical protein
MRRPRISLRSSGLRLLTRSVYDMSSVATHVAKERKAVARIKLYVVAVLHQMLEI